MMASLYYTVFTTPMGWMGALASTKGLVQTTLPQSSSGKCLSILKVTTNDTFCHNLFARLISRLNLYMKGVPIHFGNEPIDLDDTPPFLASAWKACISIPIGETRTYKWLAIKSGNPKASRLAGQSMARNRLPIIVPCHRIIGSDGKLRGFGGGTTQLDLKLRLLKLEAQMNSCNHINDI